MNYLHVPSPLKKGPHRFMEQPVPAQRCNTEPRPPNAGERLKTLALLVGHGTEVPDLYQQLIEAAKAFNPEVRL